MKRYALCLTVSAFVMFALPWLAVTFVKDRNGMAACLLLFFAVNPIYAIMAGAFAGKDVKTLWSLPIVVAVMFLAGAWALLSTGETAFFVYASIYLVLGTVAMLVSAFTRKKRRPL